MVCRNQIEETKSKEKNGNYSSYIWVSVFSGSWIADHRDLTGDGIWKTNFLMLLIQHACLQAGCTGRKPEELIRISVKLTQ